MEPAKHNLEASRGLIGLVVGFLGAQFAALVVVVFVIVIWTGFGDMEMGAEAPETTLPVLAGALVGTQGFIILVALAVPLISRVRLRSALGLTRAPVVTYIAGAVGVVGLAPLADVVMNLMASIAPDLTLGSLPDMFEVFRQESFFLLWPLIALTPGICEELFFRGMLQRSLYRHGTTLAVVVTGFAFAVFHIDPHHAAGVLPLGLYLGFLGARTRSTLVPIVAHIFNNTASLLSVNIDAFNVGYGTDTAMPLWWTPVGLVVTAICTLVVWWFTRQKRAGNSNAVLSHEQ